MENTLNFIEKSQDLEIDDYEKIIDLCKKKICDKKHEENILFIQRIQTIKNIDENRRIMHEFKKYLALFGEKNQSVCFSNYNFHNKHDTNIFDKFCETIKCFDLSGTCINCTDENKRNQLVKDFTANSNLYKSLNLSYNNIGETGINILFEFLIKETNLSEINMSNSCLDDNCILKLEELAESNPNIKKIIIRNNNIIEKKTKYPNIIIF